MNVVNVDVVVLRVVVLREQICPDEPTNIWPMLATEKAHLPQSA